MLSTRWAFSFAVLAAACGGSTHSSEGANENGDCAPGSERCPCYGNGTCDDGLDCLSGICVDADGSASGGGANGGGANGGNAGGGNANGGNASGGGGNANGGGGNAGTGGNPVCVGMEYSNELVPIDMYFLMDRSGSMEGDNWKYVKVAVSEFVDRPKRGDFRVGLGFFPPAAIPDQCTNDHECLGFGPCNVTFPGFGTCEGTCNANGYASPDVPFQSLPGGGNAAKEALASTSPSGGTPMAPALEGAIRLAASNLAVNPAHLTAVVLVTDGLPEGCGGSDSVSAVAAVAAEGQQNSVQTFVVGIGDELAALEQIAVAGGTSSALIVGAGADFSDALSEQLSDLRGEPQCTFPLPEDESGPLNYDALTVTFTPDGSAREPFSRVTGEAQCGADVAYYLDDALNPTTLILCPRACDRLREEDGRLLLDVGC